MKAMILAAGLGTRLRPLTNKWPKPALPLLGQPLFRYNLAVLRNAGVTSVGINTHHLPHVMRACAEAETKRLGMSLEVVHEPEIQGTGGGIRGLRRFLQDDAFVVFNGDILFALDLKAAVAAHHASKAAATMVLMPMPPNEKYAAVEMDATRTVRRIAGHGPGGEKLSSWHFTGVHVMSPAVFDFMKASGPEDINREVYAKLMAKGLSIHGHVVQTYWSDLGTPSRYLATQQDLLFGQVPLDVFGDASPFARVTAMQGGWKHAAARRNDAGIAGPAFLDEASDVQRNARIGSAVYVGPRAKILDGARLNRVAVMDDTTVGNEELVETIAWEKERIAAPLSAKGG